MGQKIFYFGKDRLDTRTLVALARDDSSAFKLDQNTEKKIDKSRKIVEEIVAKNKTVYGINTGFGFLSDVKIPAEQTQELQHKIILSHACGVGPALEPEVALGIMIAKVHSLALASSGIRLECLKSLMALIENKLDPDIYARAKSPFLLVTNHVMNGNCVPMASTVNPKIYIVTLMV